MMSITHLIGASILALLFGGVCASEAGTPKDFFQNSDLTDPANYSPSGLPSGAPSISTDLLLTSSAPVLTLNAANLSMGTLNQTANLNRTIANTTATSTSSTMNLGRTLPNSTAGANASDALYLGCPTCSLTLQGPNGGDGLGVLSISTNGPFSSNFNIAEPGATLNISATLIPGTSTSVT